MKMALVMLVIVVFTAAFVVSLIWTINSPGNSLAGITLTVVCIAETPIIILAVFHGLWRPVARNYPEQEHGEDAITRKFQSFGLGIVNMGFSIHATVDASYLHIRPVTWLRVLGASPMSIPWDAMKPKGATGRVVSLTDGPRLEGPKWCFTLLQSGDQDDSNA
ncbi:MAG: hypothetical protein VX527_01070 [Planctomycetota bacterium]|nr:hypothetical protein [Planctomycetota bacterium]